MTKIVVHHLAYSGGTYIGPFSLPDGDPVVTDEGIVEVPSPPARADQTWNGSRWVFPFRHYANASGVYIGEVEEGTQVPDSIETRSAPVDASDQIWVGTNWAWKTHYFRDAAGNYLGSYAGPDKPAGFIEVQVPPDDARQVWDAANELWGPAPE